MRGNLAIPLFLIVLLALPLLSAAPSNKEIIDTQSIEDSGFTLEVETSEEIKWEKEGNSYTPVFKDDSKYDITIDNKTGKEINRTLKPIPTITFNVNKLEEERCTVARFKQSCSKVYWDFTTFEEKNNITKKTITGNHPDLLTCIWDENVIFVSEIRECLESYESYDIVYEGRIIDLDPKLELAYSATTALGWNNKTEFTLLGARLEAPILSMTFDTDNESGGYVKDGSVYNKFGTNSGATFNSSCGVTGAGNDLGGCFEFDGIDDEIVFSTVDLTGAFTISAWVYPSTLGNYDGIVMKTASDDGLRHSTGGNIAIRIGGSSATSSTGSIANGAWYQVVATRDSSDDIVYYINGENAGTASKSGTLNLGTIGNSATAGRYWDGSIDQVQLWDIALTSDEVSNLYNGTKNNTEYWGKYANEGNFSSLVFYNATSINWNVTQSIANSNYTETWNTTELVSYWKLNQDVTDSVGSNDGTNYGSTDTVGIVRHGRSFDGVNDYINAGTAPASLDADAGTISMWVKSGFSGAGSAYYQAPIQIQSNSWLLYLNRYSAGTASFIFDGSSGTGAETNQVVVDDEWHHLVGTNNGTHTLTYVDGVLDDTFVETPVNPAGLIYIGKSTANAYEMNGSIDEVMIYNRSLSATEVTDLFTEQSKYYGIGWGADDGVGINSSNLVSYWTLDETYDDLVGSNDGTPTGTNDATGLSSGAMRFDGSDDGIAISSYDFSTNHSISLWFNSDSIEESIDQGLFGSAGTTRYCEIDSTTEFQCETNTNTDYVSISFLETLQNNKWYHLVLVEDDSQSWFLYLNGVLQGNDNTANSDLTITTLGASRLAPGYSKLDGYLDEVLIYNKTLTPLEVTEIYKAGLSQHANANVTLETRTATSYNTSDANLVSLWGLNGDATDETGLNNGTESDGAFNDANGTVGQGYSNEGAGVISISDDNSLDFACDDPFSVTMWINPDNTDGFDNPLDKTDGSYLGYMLYWYDTLGSIAFSFGDSSASRIRVSSDDKINIGEWNHVVVTFDGVDYNGVNFYFDGVLAEQTIRTSGSPSTCVNSNDLTIGNGALGNAEGSYDEIRIYNRSLSQAEAQNLYELGSYHIEWNAWQDEGVKQDGVPITSTGQGKFMQFRDKFQTDDTDVSAYVLNYSVSIGETPTDNPPYWLAEPTDISVLDNTTIFEINNVTDDNGVDACWTNETFLGANSTNYYNITALTAGTYSINLSCNDTIGQTNSTFFTVEINTSATPVITIVYPANGTTHTSTQSVLNGTVTGSMLGSCWYSVDGGATNSSAQNCSGGTFAFAGVSDGEGDNTWTVFGNNTNGVEGSDSVTFTVDLPPTVTIATIICPEDILGYYNPSLPSIKLRGCIQ